MKRSDQIGSLLDLLRTAQSECYIAREQVSDADKEIQDILHWLEFNESLPVDGEGAMLILGVIGMIQRDRRAAKDIVRIMRPITEWIAGHKSTVKSLEQLLGDVRKAEKDTEDRHYTDRTDIMMQILGAPDDGEKVEEKAPGCEDCICRKCLYWWSSRCPYGSCYDDHRAETDPYDAAHPDEPPRKLWSGWETQQAYWCRGGMFYPVSHCGYFVRYKGQQVRECLKARVSVFQDGYIQCSIVDSIGCQGCYKEFGDRQEE